jgi:hypothetical protein
MARIVDYETFWRFASNKAAKGNDMVFHPCCDVWTSRNSKLAQTSHLEAIKWRQVLHSLPKTELEQKNALRAKMIEERWQIPIVMNQHCTSNLGRLSAFSQVPTESYEKNRPKKRLSKLIDQRIGTPSRVRASEERGSSDPKQSEGQTSEKSTQLTAVSFLAVAWSPITKPDTRQESQNQAWIKDLNEAISLVSQVCIATCASVHRIAEKMRTDDLCSKAGAIKLELQAAMEPLYSLPSSNNDILRVLSSPVITQTFFISLLFSSNPLEVVMI